MDHENITAEAVENRALQARKPMSHVLAAAGVSPGTFYAWKRGDTTPRPLTKLRLWDAAE